MFQLLTRFAEERRKGVQVLIAASSNMKWNMAATDSPALSSSAGLVGGGLKSTVLPFSKFLHVLRRHFVCIPGTMDLCEVYYLSVSADWTPLSKSRTHEALTRPISGPRLHMALRHHVLQIAPRMSLMWMLGCRD